MKNQNSLEQDLLVSLIIKSYERETDYININPYVLNNFV